MTTECQSVNSHVIIVPLFIVVVNSQVGWKLLVEVTQTVRILYIVEWQDKNDNRMSVCVNFRSFHPTCEVTTTKWGTNINNNMAVYWLSFSTTLLRRL